MARPAASARRPRPRIGLALAGGGPLGAIYEIGALCALDDALVGRRLTDCDGYVGVSAGGFIAAGLANDMSPRDLWASFIANEGDADDIFEPSLLMRPAWGEYARRVRALPTLVAQAAWILAFDRRRAPSLLDRLGRVLPAGLFSSDGIHRRLSRQFSQPGRSNDFRQLAKPLVLVATELDTGESAPFGMPGFDHVPISKAVQASAALPGLYPPVEIDGREYVDGALKKTLHASVLLDQGLDLLICLNPLVPFDASRSHRHRVMAAGMAPIPQIADAGLPVVLSQTFRTLIHSRLELGVRSYALSHPDTTILLFEPDHRDPQMFLASTFGYAQRRHLAEHAYQQTRKMLRGRRSELARQLAPHGLALDDDALDDPRRGLEPSGRRRLDAAATVRRLEDVLDDLERVMKDWPGGRRAHGVKTPGKTHRRPAVISR